MKKTLNVIKNILVWTLLAAAICMMIFTLFSVNTFNKTDRDVFGYKFFIVTSDSMSKTDFSAGDIVIVKEVKASTLKEGDIISFISQNDVSFGETVTHKIRQVLKDEKGNLGFVTYGTTSGNNDEKAVTSSYLLGKYVGKIPNLGHFFAFLKTTPGYIVCIFIPFLLLILYQGLNCIKLFRRYKKEQTDEIKEERAKLEEERKQSAEMLKELQALKEQLAQASKTAEQDPEESEEKTTESEPETTEGESTDNI